MSNQEFWEIIGKSIPILDGQGGWEYIIPKEYFDRFDTVEQAIEFAKQRYNENS